MTNENGVKMLHVKVEPNDEIDLFNRYQVSWYRSCGASEFKKFPSRRMAQDWVNERRTISLVSAAARASLLESILGSTIPVDGVLLPTSTLEDRGINFVVASWGERWPEGTKYIFLDMEKLKRYLLRETPQQWAECEHILLSFPGAQRARRMGMSGVIIPVASLVRHAPRKKIA